ncbi:Mor transcription activator family protein [Variovorax atrisoli]|uniref:Mor transcription activator family protein n=1 Tax=Variovorax atrisoli TaxID=3394203 RepID=UPI0017EE7AB7|nr:Mor transcription activator family protein [Variovorax sp. BK613]MBB3642601.1 Mor family transcriptional regulator [Variovorax sp. BK613]
MTELPFVMSPGQTEDAAVQLEHDIIGIVREEIGMHEQMATVFAQALVRGLRRRLGGQEIYIPAASKGERDAAIRRDFNGANIEHLMRRHGLSRTRIYEILAPASRTRAR